MGKKTYDHWEIDFDSDNILWLGFAKKNAEINTLSLAVIVELQSIIEEQAKSKSVKGLVIHALHRKGFIAGADVDQFEDFKDPESAKEMLELGHHTFDFLEKLDFPTVALIDGFCLGGGLELALSCTYRIALDEDSVRMGLPEVRLGIHPGWGGTVRLVKLIPALSALDLMMTGRTVSASAAKKIGLVNETVPARELERAAIYFIKHSPRSQFKGIFDYFFRIELFRKLVAKVLRRKLSNKIKPNHYPAPYAILALWQTYGYKNEEEAKKAEIESLLAIIHNSDTPKQLLRIFFLRERLKRFTKESDKQIKRVHVVGSGLMGADIALCCVLHGMTVTLQDREASYLASALKKAEAFFQKKLKKPRKVLAAMDRLIPDVAGEGIAKADLIIEAIFEDLSEKQKLFKSIEKRARLDALLATNTSSIPLDKINQVMAEPERLVGIHFFNPVDKMPLVEIVRGERTKEVVLQQAQSFVGQIDHLPLPVKSQPGFLVNRVLMPYLMESMLLLEEGISAQDIDSQALAFGMPMGPVELADRVGLDVCLSVAENLLAYFQGDVPEKLKTMVQQGKLGYKSGEGFYRYKRGKAKKARLNRLEAGQKTRIRDRLISRLVNEAAACLREEVVEDQDLLDAGLIFGTGFAPFRGGPMQYAKKLGKHDFMQQVEKLQSEYGARFRPDPYWTKREGFHG